VHETVGDATARRTYLEVTRQAARFSLNSDQIADRDCTR
jgi:hypothetical protein